MRVPRHRQEWGEFERTIENKKLVIWEEAGAVLKSAGNKMCIRDSSWPGRRF